MDNNRKLRIFILVFGILVSIYVFGTSFAFLISIIFILTVTTRFLQNLDNQGLLSIVTVAAPIINERVGKICLAGYSFNRFLVGINELINNNHIPYIVKKDDIDALIVYVGIIFLVMLFSNNDTTAIGKHVPDGDPEFREKTFKEKNDIFCSTLAKRIERINIELNWNDSLYIPIATEVEMTKGKSIKRYDDMLKCIKRNRIKSSPFIVKIIRNIRLTVVGKSRILNMFFNKIISKYENKEVYLVLGDPGAGKSVSLRKLCTDLLKEAHVTGKTAVYINLKTWTSNGKEWSDDNLPSEKDLISFIKAELYKDGDLFTDDFLNNYFEKMLNDGRWYFIFDSFDEMPCFMGSGKNNVLIEHVSLLLNQFLSGPNQSGGIIASRMYHRPANSLNQTCTLKLQSFDNARIRSMIKKYLVADANTLIKSLFSERNDLVNLCRNPFHLALLINYIKRREYMFPENQFDLFKDFIDERLNKSIKKIQSEGFTTEEVYYSAIDLSLIMQRDISFGLEFPIYEVIKKSDLSINWEKMLSILEYIKICRFGGNKTTVSFVHRRFQEFFFVEGIMKKKTVVSESDYEGILSNTGIRDALVLYCQIGDEDSVQEISNYCLSTIEQNTGQISGVLNMKSAELVNALYFLSEAFANRKKVIMDKLHIIANLRSYLMRNTDYIILMAIVNSISLLNPEDIQKSILDIFRLNNRWLNENIANNCSIIKEIDRQVERSFCRYFERQDYIYLLRNYLNTDFSLSLTENFKYIRRVHQVLPFYITSNTIARLWGVFFIVSPFAKITLDNVFSVLSIARHHFDSNMLIDYIRGMKVAYEKIPRYTEEMTKAAGIKGILGNMIIINVVLYAILEIYRITYEQQNIDNAQLNIVEESKKSVFSRYFLFRKKNWNTSSYNWKTSLELNLISRASLLVLLFCMREPYIPIIVFISLFIISFDFYQIYHEIIRVIIDFIAWKSKEEIIQLFIEKIKKIYLIPFRIWTYFRDNIIEIIVSSVKLVIRLLVLFFLMGFIIMGIPYIICLMSGIKTTESNVAIMIVIFWFVALLALIILVGVINSIRVLREYYWIKKQDISKIDRKEFDKIVKKIKSTSNRRYFINDLKIKGVKLEGEWPDGERIITSDDVFNRELAEWDRKENSIEIYHTNGY